MKKNTGKYISKAAGLRAWHQAYVRKAQDFYTGRGGQFMDGDINIDDGAAVSESNDGAYVAAWVWVPKSALPKNPRT